MPHSAGVPLVVAWPRCRQLVVHASRSVKVRVTLANQIVSVSSVREISRAHRGEVKPQNRTRGAVDETERHAADIRKRALLIGFLTSVFSSHSNRSQHG